MRKSNPLSMSKLLVWVMAITLSFGAVSCKSKKKLAEEQAAKELAEKTTQVKGQLEKLMAKENSTLEEVAQDETLLNTIRGYNLEDSEVKMMIDKTQSKLDADKARIKAALEAERLAREAEEKRKAEEARVKEEMKDVYYYFDNIVGSGKDVNLANQLIGNALDLFQSPETVVLIEVYNDGTVVDYDKPTTAEKYLNYLKDVQKPTDRIKEYKKDANGKITELILTKVK